MEKYECGEQSIGSPARGRTTIPLCDRTRPLPVTCGQQRLRFFEALQSVSSAYNALEAFRLYGSLNVDALRRALNEIVRRHESLRTTFAERDGEVVQVFHALREILLPTVDLCDVPVEEQATEIAQRAAAEGALRFDLARDLLVRATLLRFSPKHHVLLLTMHHIATDGWSLGVFLKELSALYAAFADASPSPLPDLPIQYADYTQWQGGMLQGEYLDRLLAYWKARLQGIPEQLELPTDRPRPPVMSFRGATVDFSVPPHLTAELHALSRSEEATLFMTLLAAWQLLLSRYSGAKDVVVGSPVAGRNLAELEGLIGFFANTLPLRSNLSGNPPFREFLRKVREMTLEAYTHQDLPFERLVEELQPKRYPNRNPLFQAMFVLQNAPSSQLELPDLEVSRLPIKNSTLRFDLTLSVRTLKDGLRGSLEYSTDLFEAATITRLLGHFQTLLHGIVTDPQRRIDELPLLTQPERQQLLVQWNDTAVFYPCQKCVHELFEEQVERTPAAVAVIFGDQQLTYHQLNEQANQLAHALRHRGVGPETLVGLCLERSPELIIGILGILKAGGGYVPLDDGDPRQRLEFMVRDTKVDVLVTQQRLRQQLPTYWGQVLALDTDVQHLREMPRENLTVKMSSDNLAYVMFTSGSTGQPKGVAIRHSSIVHLVFGNDYATFGPDRIFLQLAPVSFDASTFELWGALLHGAKLVLAPDRLPHLQQLEELIQRSGVTTVWLTSTLFNHIVEHYPRALRSVDEILTGGEALSVRHVCQAQTQLGPHVRLINGYGPTESTTFATCYRIPPNISPELESIPIGRPIANTQVYVLDAQHQPVPIGVPGELYIGGAGLARGYLNRPELTADRFVADPFSDDAEARLYRTGDRCRWRSDGNLEFLGRLDHQVKLRGFRIELSEIETVLNEHSDVAQSVVILREDRPGDKRLVAYCVLAGKTAPNVPGLSSHLRKRLPEYMVPATIVVLDTLPLTSNGKVDRRALPTPDDSRPELEREYIAPRTAIEEQLASIWCEVLGVNPIGIHDDFFALGGNSLLGVQLIGRINGQLKAKLRIVDIFRLPTIGQIGDSLAAPRQEPANSDFLSVLRPSTGRGSVVLVGGPLMTELLKALPPAIGLFHLAMDGRETDTFHRFDVDATVDRYAAEFLRTRPQCPLVIVGFSYCGLLAYGLTLRLRRVFQATIEAVLVEPAVPQELEIAASPNFLSRIRSYCRKLYQGGPMALYRSVRFRLHHFRPEPPPQLDSEISRQWKMCQTHYHRNIVTYRPPHLLKEGVHLVASASWLFKYLDTFQTQFAKASHICNVGDVEHNKLPEDKECAASVIKLVNEILGES